MADAINQPGHRPGDAALDRTPLGSASRTTAERRGARTRIRTRLLGGALALALIVLFCWAWNSDPINLKDRIFPNHLAEVYPGQIYRSGQIAPNLIESTLAKLHIGLIVDLSHDLGSSDAAQVAEAAAARKLGIERVRFPLEGSGTGRVEHYIGAVTAIARGQREGRRILVHCRAGDRRSGGVLAAYALLVRREPVERAYEEIGRFARLPLPSSKVVGYLNEHLDEIAAGLVQNGVIDGVPANLPKL